MKKTLFILIPSLIVAVIIYLVFQAIIARNADRGALQVTASPKSKVYLDGRYLGETPLCKCDSADMLLTGDYTIRLVPSDTSLQPYEDKVTITKSVLTVVDRSFGQGGLSEGSVISLVPTTNNAAPQLTVVSFPDQADVNLDGNPAGKTALHLTDLTESDHVLTLKKNGYKEKIVRIRTPKGYKLQATVYLGVGALSPTPTNAPATSPAVSPSAAVTPTQQVTILQTPTGFLRVRSDASLGASEIGEVKPGETYPLVSQSSGWYEIKLTDGMTGWISSQYAEIK